MWETSHPLSFAVAGYAIAASIMPNLVLIAAGHLVGSIPAAAASGLGSAAGHRLVFALAVTGALYAAALVLGPVQSSLSSVVKWRLVYRTEERLMAAVSGPVGIAHLEDPAVLDDLALAQGQLTGQMPADAPMTLALVVSNRVSGLFACCVLASWRWWLGLGMFVMWMAVRRPQLALIREQGALYAGSSEDLRRAWYLQRLAASPGVAKESRVFGLGGWLVDRYRSTFLAAMAAPWAVLRRLDRAVLFLSLPVLVVFLASCGYLGLAAYRGEIGLGTLAVMLPMLAATTPLGDISWDDVLLILDEPTASLDAITEAALFERYLSARELARRSGAITLLVSHRFSTVRMADLIVVLDQGRIVASGDHASLIRAGGLYAELYELQARAYR